MDPSTVLILCASLFLGWCAGSNDAASAVGTSLGAQTLTFRKAVAIVVIFSMLGFLLQGGAVAKTVGQGILPKDFFENHWQVVLAALLAVAAVTLVTVLLSLPISINHALVGGILGIGVIVGMTESFNYPLLVRIMACWLTTPVIAFTATIVIHQFVVKPLAGRMNWIDFTRTFRFLSVASAAVVSYNLGASAIGSILSLAISSNTASQLSPVWGLSPVVLLGIGVALAFGFGVMTFSDRVVKTLSSRIALLGPATAFSAQFGAALTVYAFVLMGLPASITHAVVGGIAGIGVLKKTKTLNWKTLQAIVFGWMLTPLLSAALAVGIYKVIAV